MIDVQLQNISEQEKSLLARDKLQTDAKTRSFSLPPVEVSDKLLRYEAHFDRQLHRAMAELERLQRRRKRRIRATASERQFEPTGIDILPNEAKKLFDFNSQIGCWYRTKPKSTCIKTVNDGSRDAS